MCYIIFSLGWVPGWKKCLDSMILMYLALEHFINNPEEEALLLQVDFEKAFDSVEHKFLFETLEFLGFGKSSGLLR